jgi:hypothetical protein
LVSGALICFGHSAANAAVVINAVESGSDVIFSYTGQLDLSSLNSAAGLSWGYVGVKPDIGQFQQGAGSVDAYTGLYFFLPFGVGGETLTTNQTGGNKFGLMRVGSSDTLIVTAGYQSGQILSGDLTFANKDFSTLGVEPATYYISWSNNGFSDSITMNIGSVPVPAPLPLLGLGAATAFSRKLKQRIALRRKREEVGAAV